MCFTDASLYRPGGLACQKTDWRRPYYRAHARRDGPITYGPGEAVGAPDHPHRGFETVTSVQWMTAGAGIVHSEEPSDQMKRDGGTMHGFQLWVNPPKGSPH